VANENPIPAYATIVVRSTATTGEVLYEAWHPEINGCLGQGATPEEAEADLAEATALVLEHLVARDRSIPKPFKLRGQAMPLEQDSIKEGRVVGAFLLPTLAPAVAGTMR